MWSRQRINTPLLLAGVAAAALVGCSSSGNGKPADTGRDQARDSVLGRDTGGKDGTFADTSGDTSGDTSVPPVGQGYAVGQISMNWTLLDQSGKAVNLYDYVGKVIYFESGSEW